MNNEIVTESAPTMTLAVPEHAPHTEKDSADFVLAKEEKKRRETLAEQSIQSMKGFTKVYTCPNCRKRIVPATMGGQPTGGTCPYCKTYGHPNERSHYIGDPAHKNLSNPYAKPVTSLFDEGAKNFGESGINRRFNVRKEGE